MLAGTEEKLGPKHPHTLHIVDNLATIYSEDSRYDKALELYKRALVGRKEKLGLEHPDTLTTLEDLVTVYRRRANTMRPSSGGTDWPERPEGR